MCDLYGFISADLTQISKDLESVLGVSFELHDSLFHGGDYYLFRKRKPLIEELILQRNAELEDELAEPEFSEYQILLYVCLEDVDRLSEIREKILSVRNIGAILLRPNDN